MEFFATIIVSFSLFFSSLFGGVLGWFNIFQTQAPTTTTTAEQTSVATTTVPFQNYPNQSSYYTDGNLIYFQETILEGADPVTFVAFKFDAPGGGDEYGKDKNAVYFYGWIIPEADPPTFEVFDSIQSCGQGCSFSAKDKNHKYQQNRIVE